ncbi:response regulator [bacterium]|nr:response regulator [bacterium]
MVNAITILVVEDSPTQALLLKHLLENNSYHVLVAKNGKEAIDSIQNKKPNLIISDIMMPEMDGYTMCRTIKSNDAYKDIPVILLTMLSDPEDVVKGLEARAEAYVTKPYDEKHLLSKVKSILETSFDEQNNGELEVKIEGKRYVITSNRQQILNLLLCTYERAVQQNRELIKVQDQLKILNEQLEEKVEERTAELRTEIAERKRIEKILQLANERLKELDALKSDFLSTVSHELRTPLAIMREGVSLCLEEVVGKITEKQKQLLIHTKENIDRLSRLIMDLLDISKIEAKKIVLWRKATDIGEIVRKIQSNFKPQAMKKRIKMNIQLPEVQVRLFVDEDKVMQIFNNLVSNAVQYTEAGGDILIGVEEKEEVVSCFVSDTGIGIAKENISKLFSKFEQIGRVEGPGYKGTGLGLAIVKGLVEKHGGKIEVESDIGKGTTFFFTLKKVPFPKILIVDDDQKIIDEVKDTLNVEGYFFLEANNGIDAMELTFKENPALIILDMVLPGMNGYEIIGRLKQDKRSQNVPILILSAHTVDTKRLDHIDHLSAIPIQKKPIERDQLRNNIRELLAD